MFKYILNLILSGLVKLYKLVNGEQELIKRKFKTSRGKALIRISASALPIAQRGRYKETRSSNQKKKQKKKGNLYAVAFS